MKRFVLVLMAVLIPLTGFAKIYKFKDGTSFSGKIVSRNTDKIFLEDDRGNVIQIPADMLIEPVAPAEKKEAGTAAEADKNSVNSNQTVYKPVGFNLIVAGSYLAGSYLTISQDTSLGGMIQVEFQPVQYMGIYAAYNFWPSVIMGSFEAGLRVHFAGHQLFDPFIGVGFAGTYRFYGPNNMYNDMHVDIPASAGFNIWFNNNVALRIEDRFYILSIDEPRNEITAGFDFAF